ncbi:unnamed protein product [Lathyrus oleraceus]
MWDSFSFSASYFGKCNLWISHLVDIYVREPRFER